MFLIKSVFVGKKSFVLINMRGETTIKIILTPFSALFIPTFPAFRNEM